MNKDYNIAWEVTENCNHNCFYCYNYWRTGDFISEHTQVEYKKITEKLISLNPISVAFTGGEPLLVFDKIKDSIKKISDSGIFIRLLTNGSLITDEIADFLAQHNIQLMVSFPSSNKDIFATITKRSDYHDVVRGLDILKKHNNDVLINIVVSSLNLEEMENTAKFLLDRYGYKILYFSRATKPQSADTKLQESLLDNVKIQEFFNKALQIRKKFDIEVRTCGGYAYCAIENQKAYSIFAKGCGGGNSSFVVSNNGDIRVCGKDAHVFGNLFDEDIDKIMQRASFWTEDSAIPKECNKCKFKYHCRGGCHMSSYDAHPKYNSLDANAMPHKASDIIHSKKKVVFINPLKNYTLHQGVNFQRINEKNRFSYMFFCSYLPDKLSDALRNSKRVNLIKIMYLTGFSLKKSKKLIAELLYKKIIVGV